MLHSNSYFYLARATALFAHTSTLPQLLVLAQHWNRHVSVASFIELAVRDFKMRGSNLWVHLVGTWLPFLIHVTTMVIFG